MVSFRPEGLKNPKGAEQSAPFFLSTLFFTVFHCFSQSFVIPQITRNHEKRRSFFYHGIHGLARAIAPGYPPHVIQHGNRRRQAFFSNADYEACLALMAEWCARYRVEVWAYCLMPNHAHLICVSRTEDRVRLGGRQGGPCATRRRVNLRGGWRRG